MATVINEPEKIEAWERGRLKLLGLIAEAPIMPLDIRPKFYRRFPDARLLRGETLEEALERMLLDERIEQSPTDGTIAITPFGERLLKRYRVAIEAQQKIQHHPSPQL